MTKRNHDGEDDEDDTRDEGRHARPIATSKLVRRNVQNVLRRVDGGQDAEEEGHGCAKPRTEPGERHDGADSGQEGDRRREGVLAERNAGLAVEEGVVERVDEAEKGCAAEGERLAPR